MIILNIGPANYWKAIDMFFQMFSKNKAKGKIVSVA